MVFFWHSHCHDSSFCCSCFLFYPWNCTLVCQFLPLCDFPSFQCFSIPYLTCPFPTSLHLFLIPSQVCVCVCVCVFIVFVLPHVVGSFLRLLSSSVFNGRYSVSVCGPLCRCPVFLNHVSSCLALVCFWFLFLLFLIDLIDLPLLHFV